MTDSSVKTLLVTGARGQLGMELAQAAHHYPNYQWHFTGRAALDLADPDAIAAIVAEIQPDVIINTAAYTAVDKAETETELADAINHLAVASLAQAAKLHGSRLLHVSTDYVFNGCQHRPYTERDTPKPVSVYGATKRAGEEAFITSGAKGAIVRTSWVYSAFGSNFVNTMRRLGREREQLTVVSDQIGSPTWAADLAQALIVIATGDTLGRLSGEIYHYSNEGVCSWYDLAHSIMALENLPCRIAPINTEDYPTPAQRPAYSVLDKRKLKRDFGLEIPHWHDSLSRALPGFPGL